MTTMTIAAMNVTRSMQTVYAMKYHAGCFSDSMANPYGLDPVGQ